MTIASVYLFFGRLPDRWRCEAVAIEPDGRLLLYLEPGAVRTYHPHAYRAVMLSDLDKAVYGTRFSSAKWGPE